MPVFTPGPTKRGFLPKKRFDICSRGNAIGGTTLLTITSCTSFIERPAKSKSDLICRPYSSPVRSFSVCTRKESRSRDSPWRNSNTPSTVFVLPTSIARSTSAVSGAFRRSVNVTQSYLCSQHGAVLDIGRHHPTQGAIGGADQERAVLGQIDRFALEGRRIAVDEDAPAESAGELPPALAHRAKPLGLVQRHPFLEVLEHARAGERPRDALPALDQEARAAEVGRKVVRREQDVEPHAEHDVADALGLGPQLGEEPGQLLAAAFDVVGPLDARSGRAQLVSGFAERDGRRQGDLRSARGQKRGPEDDREGERLS